MTSQTITRGLVVLAIGVVAVFFWVQNSLLGINREIPKQLDSITQAAQRGQWREAHQAYQELSKTWNKSRGIIAFNYAEPDYLIFVENMGRLRVAVEQKEKQDVGSYSALMKDLFENFTQLVPLP